MSAADGSVGLEGGLGQVGRVGFGYAADGTAVEIGFVVVVVGCHDDDDDDDDGGSECIMVDLFVFV